MTSKWGPLPSRSHREWAGGRQTNLSELIDLVCPLPANFSLTRATDCREWVPSIVCPSVFARTANQAKITFFVVLSHTTGLSKAKQNKKRSKPQLLFHMQVVNNNNNSIETAIRCLHHVLAVFPELPLETFSSKLEQAWSDIVRLSSSSSSSLSLNGSCSSSNDSSSNNSSNSNNNIVHIDGSVIVAVLRSMDWTAICNSHDKEQHHHRQVRARRHGYITTLSTPAQTSTITTSSYSTTSTTTTSSTPTTLLEQLLHVWNHNPVVCPPLVCHIWIMQVLLEHLVWAAGYHDQHQRQQQHDRRRCLNTTTTSTPIACTNRNHYNNRHQWPASQQLLLQHITQWLFVLVLPQQQQQQQPNHHTTAAAPSSLLSNLFSVAFLATTTTEEGRMTSSCCSASYPCSHPNPNHCCHATAAATTTTTTTTVTRPQQPRPQRKQHTATTLNIALSVWKHWWRQSSSLSLSSSAVVLQNNNNNNTHRFVWLLLPLLWDWLSTMDDTEAYYQQLYSLQQQQQEEDEDQRQEETPCSITKQRRRRRRPVAAASLAQLHGENENDDNDDDDDDSVHGNARYNNKQSYPQQQHCHHDHRHATSAATQLLELRKVRSKCLHTLQSFVKKHVVDDAAPSSKHNYTRSDKNGGWTILEKQNVDLYLHTLEQQQHQSNQRPSIFMRLSVLFLLESSPSSSTSLSQKQQSAQPCVDNYHQQLLQAIWWRKNRACTVNMAAFWLSLYTEFLVECAVFDQQEHLLWNGIQPFLFDWLLQPHRLPKGENENVEDGTTACATKRVLYRLHLQALAFVMTYRGNILIKHRQELQTILAQLSNQYDQPNDWLDASSLSPNEYGKLQMTLQEMGVFGFCRPDRKNDCSTRDQFSNVKHPRNENSNGWFFDPSVNQTIRACGSYYWSSLFPNNHGRIFSSLSPMNASPPVAVATKANGLAKQQQKQLSVPMMENINDDMLRHIFSFLGYKRIVRIRLVCHSWKQIADHEDFIWKPLYKYRFGYSLDDPALLSDTSSTLAWKQLFIDRWIAERAIRFRRNKNGWKARLCRRIGCLTILSTPGRLRRHNLSHTAKYLLISNNKIKAKKRSRQSETCSSSGRATKKIKNESL